MSSRSKDSSRSDVHPKVSRLDSQLETEAADLGRALIEIARRLPVPALARA